jgi:hypothetical protein
MFSLIHKVKMNYDFDLNQWRIDKESFNEWQREEEFYDSFPEDEDLVDEN